MKQCKLCGSKKIEDIEKYEEQIGEEKYKCEKCGKTAEEKENICMAKENKKSLEKENEKDKIEHSIEKKKDKKDKKMKKLGKKKMKNLTVEEFMIVMKEVMK